VTEHDCTTGAQPVSFPTQDVLVSPHACASRPIPLCAVSVSSSARRDGSCLAASVQDRWALSSSGDVHGDHGHRQTKTTPSRRWPMSSTSGPTTFDSVVVGFLVSLTVVRFAARRISSWTYHSWVQDRVS